MTYQDKWRYFYCYACKTWTRERIPADPFAALACSCGCTDPDKLRAAEGHREIAKAKKEWKAQERRLPFDFAPNQYIKKSYRFMVEVWPTLKSMDRDFVDLVLLYTDHKTGLTPPMSIGMIASYLAPGGRQSLSKNTVRDIIHRLCATTVEIYSEAERGDLVRPLLIQTATFPRRYRLNMP